MQIQFDSVSAALTMGGHGPFVWAAYAITFAAIIFLLIAPMSRKRRFFRDHAGRLKREQIERTRAGGAS